MQLVWLDLCSGLGGASQPAKDRGWCVIRVDIDSRFKPDIVADVRKAPWSHYTEFKPDVLWAFPPCNDFAKHNLRCFYREPPEPDLSIALGIKQAIRHLNPRHWIVENVWASRAWFVPIFGPVSVLVSGHALWCVPQFLLPDVRHHKGRFTGKERREPYYPDRGPVRAAMRAKVPYEIGEAICIAVERRTETDAANSTARAAR